MKTTKISIIGVDQVGSQTAFTLMLNRLATHIVLVDINHQRAEGEAADIFDGTSLVGPTKVYAGKITDTKDSDIVIICAGVSQKPGESRLDLINRNIIVYKDLIPQIAKQSPNSILLVVSNPVDILTYVTYKLSGFPQNRVLGSGTVLDTERLKSNIASKLNIDARNICANILGEHGDSEIVVWSNANISGTNIKEYCQTIDKCHKTFFKTIANEVKNSAYDVILKKGYTNFAVSLAVTRIVTSILKDENAILTTSTYLKNFYGVSDLYLSVPTIIGKNGTSKIININLNIKEQKAFIKSANLIKDLLLKAGL